MTPRRFDGRFSVYTVTPPFDQSGDRNGDQSRDQSRGRQDFSAAVRRTARRTEEAGWHGILVPHNLHDVDPWMITAYLGAITERLIPLIAVQPACVPPHSAATLAASYAALFDRPIFFNLVAGARDDEMRRIGDELTHDQRYERLEHYARLLKAMLAGSEVSTETGPYRYRRFRLEPRPDAVSACRIFVAGSSAASLRVALAGADVVVTHPAPIAEWRVRHLRRLEQTGYDGELGIRVGIICRPRREDAWRLARRRFPPSWMGRQHTLLKTRSSNEWSRRLAELALEEEDAEDGANPSSPYWLGAFKSSKASAPFLVGSYRDVAEALGEYLALGVRHVLLNGVNEADDLHTGRSLEMAAEVARNRHAAGAKAPTA